MRNRNSSNHKYLVFSFVAVFAFISMFSFYGCQFLQQKNEPVNVDEATQSRRTGILKSLGGVRTSNQGTHLLQLDNGDTILLKSLQINLDDAKYIGKTVEVYGIMNYTTDKKQIMEVMSIDAVSEKSSQEVAVTTWKDYTADSLGLALKYRDDLTLDASIPGQIIFKRDFVAQTSGSQETTQLSNSITHQMIIKSEMLSQGETIVDFLKIQFAGLKSDLPQDLLASGISKSKVGADSVDSYKVVNTDGGKSVVTYYIPVKSQVLVITLESGNDENTIEDQNLFYAMLGTLQLSGTNVETQQVTNLEKDAVNDDVGTKTPASITITPSITSPASVNVPVAEKKVVEESSKKPDVSSNSKFETAVTSEVISVPKADVSAPPITSGATGATQEQISGFTTMDSSSFKFTMQYPQKWFYNGTASTETGVIRHYDFGTKPLDVQPGVASMDIMSGAIPNGATQKVGDNTVTKVLSGDQITIYLKGSGSRVYKFSGPLGQESTLLQMAGSVQ